MFTVDIENHRIVVQKFMEGFLPKFLHDDDAEFILSDSAAMCKIAGAFVLSTSSDVNNETREMVGDAYLKTCFITHLMHRFPEITEDNAQLLTDLYKKFGDKSALSSFSQELGFDKLILAGNVPITKDDREDVFEAFIGALAHISYTTLGPIFNSAYPYLFVDWFYSGVEINIKTSTNLKDPITWYKELVSDFINKRIEPPSRQWHMHTYERDGSVYLKLKRGSKIMFETSIISKMRTFGSNKKRAPKFLYEAALDYIESYTGITRETVAFKKLELFEGPNASHTAKLKERLDSLGFDKADIKIVRKHTDIVDKNSGETKDIVAILMRKDITDNYYQIASWTASSSSFAYRQAIEKFLKTHPVGDVKEEARKRRETLRHRRARERAKPRARRGRFSMRSGRCPRANN